MGGVVSDTSGKGLAAPEVKVRRRAQAASHRPLFHLIIIITINSSICNLRFILILHIFPDTLSSLIIVDI